MSIYKGSEIDREDTYYMLAGEFGRGGGIIVTLGGLIMQDTETILGGIGLIYGGQCLYKGAQDNFNDRKRNSALRGIEEKLK